MIEARAAVEFRAEGRRLSGVAIRYGDTASVFGQLERFEADAFSDLSDVRLDRQHDRRAILARTGAGLEMTDGPDALRFAAELPRTRDADDTLELVRKGVLRGASIEFLASTERLEDRVRVISGADLLAVSIVDNPAYRQSRVEARQAPRGGVRGGYSYGRVHVISNTGQLRKTRLKKGSLDFTIDEGRELTLNLGSSLDSTLGTRSSGTLEIVKRENGIDLSLTSLPETQAAADLAGLQAAGIALYARPRYTTDGVPDAFEDVPEPGNSDVLIREVSSALLLGFDLGVRGGENGYEAIERTGQGPRRRRFYA